MKTRNSFYVSMLLLMVILASHANAGGGSEVGNGAGLAEVNFAFAYTNMGRYLDACLASSSCQVTEQEKVTLSYIKAALPLEQARNAGHPLVFKSEQQESGFFVIDGLLRVAKTGDEVGSSIYVNLDLIYTNETNPPQPAGVLTATAILIHELGHHQGIKNHQQLDLLGAKVHAFLVDHTRAGKISSLGCDDLITCVIAVSHLTGQRYTYEIDLKAAGHFAQHRTYG